MVEKRGMGVKGSEGGLRSEVLRDTHWYPTLLLLLSLSRVYSLSRTVLNQAFRILTQFDLSLSETLPLLDLSSSNLPTVLPNSLVSPSQFFHAGSFFSPQPLLGLLACPKAQSLKLFSVFTFLLVLSSTFLLSYTS